MSTLRQWYTPYTRVRVWKQTSHLLLDLGVGITLFTYVATMLSLSVGLMVTLVGLPLLAFVIASGRWIAGAERARVHALLDTALPD